MNRQPPHPKIGDFKKDSMELSQQGINEWALEDPNLIKSVHVSHVDRSENLVV